MYGKNKKLGLFLGAVYTTALVTSLIMPSKQPPVSQSTSHTAKLLSGTTLDRYWSGTTLYVPNLSLTLFITHE